MNAGAQEEDKNLFNHLAVGVNVGTPSIGFDVAASVGNYVQVCAGVSFMPSISFDADLDINDVPQITRYDIPETVAIEAKVGFTNGKVLLGIAQTVL